MHRDVWWGVALGALFSIPVGLGTGLLIAPIQRWYQGWGLTREAARRNRLEREYGVALIFFRNPHRFTQFILNTLVMLIVDVSGYFGAWLIAVLAMLAKLISKASNIPLTPFEKFSLNASLLLSVLLIVSALALAVRLLQHFIKTSERVKLFGSYERTVPEEIRRIPVEESILEKGLY